MADLSISQPSSNIVSNASDVERSTTYTANRKPLIQPARLRVRKRRFSISSATAALSLTGDGWGFGDHVTNKADTRSMNSEASNPFLRVPDTHRCMNIRRNSAIIERQKVNYFQQGRVNHHTSSHFANGNGLTNHKMANNHNTPLRDSHRILSLSRLTLSNSHTTPTPYTAHHPQQLSSSSSLSPSHLPCSSNQPQSTGTPPATSNSRPHSNGVRCVVGALILFSVTGNVVLLLLLFVYVYKPGHASSMWVDTFSDL